MKTPSRALPSTVKAGGHYTNSIRALAEAQRRGFGETILLNDRGEVAEGSGENIFVVRDGILITNDADADILPGITRASVLAIARDAGITSRVRPLTLEDLNASEEAFFTGTAAEVVSISRIDDRAFGDEGPVTQRLRTAYHGIVRGERPAPGPWLTPA
jgi:branched-chain amino acid aminotransferase